HGLVGYTFDYDGANRLTKADYGYYSSGWQTTSKNDVTNLQYDDNGNITSLDRYDIDGSLMDDFTYHYTMSSYGNRLLYVDDAVSSSIADDDIDDQETGNYTYDGNGNMTGDAGKNISSIEYDIKNLPYQMDFGLLSLLTLSSIEIDNEATYSAKDTIRTQNTVSILSGGDVRFISGSTIKLKAGFSVAEGGTFRAEVDESLLNESIGSTVKYAYDAGGNRVKKSYSQFNSEKYYVRDASGNVLSVYDQDGDQEYVNLIGADIFGRYIISSSEYNYYVKDHLGSTRVTVDESGGVVDAYEYYPFGRISRQAITSNGTDEKFTGKELDNDNEERLYYFGARYYDGDLGRWPSGDPLSDKYYGWSPYNYALCDPVNKYDPDGRQVGIVGPLMSSSGLYARPYGFFRGAGRLFPGQRYVARPRPRTTPNRYVEPKPQLIEPIKEIPLSRWGKIIKGIYEVGKILSGFADDVVPAVSPIMNEDDNSSGEGGTNNDNGNNQNTSSNDGQNDSNNKNNNSVPKYRYEYDPINETWNLIIEPVEG
ncbi:MAG: RHS repeat-associated core domain-containing protein, partial [Ignavibacteria bacterium]